MVRAHAAAQVHEHLGAGRAVAVVGEAGAGASHLVSAVSTERGAVVRTGGSRLLADRPLTPFLRLLRDVTDPAPAAIAAGVVELVRSSGAATVVLEDLQWFDDRSIAVVDELVGRVPLVWTERRPARRSRSLASTAVALVELDELDDDEAAQLLQEAGVAASPSLTRAGGGNAARLIELARGERSELLARDLAAPLLELPSAGRRRAAWLGYVTAAGEGDGWNDELDADLREAGVIGRSTATVTLRFEESSTVAEASLGTQDRQALHRDLAERWHDRPALAARHLDMAGDAVAAAEMAAVAAPDQPPGPATTALWVIAASAAPPARRAERWTAAAVAAAQDGEFAAASNHSDAARLADPSCTDDPGWRQATTAALVGLGQVDAALDLAAHGDTRVEAALLAWPLLRFDRAREVAAADPFVEGVARLVLGGETAGSGNRPDAIATSSAETARLALVAALCPGRALESRVLIDASDSSGGRQSSAERAAAALLVELSTTGAPLAAVAELDRWCHDPVVAAHVAPLTSHLALAVADGGSTGEAVARLHHLDPQQVAPAAHAALVHWALAEVELAAARPRRSQDAARVALDAAPVGSVLHDLASVTLAWSAELGLPVGTPATPSFPAAANEAIAVARLVGGDWAGARSSFLEAAQGWEGRFRRAELRCRWGAAEAGRHLEPEVAVSELQAVERAADELGHRFVVARARASLREAGVRRRPQRGTHASGLTLREVEVLEGIADGMTSGDVALRLGVARSTVDTLADSARRKLGARNRRHAVVLFREANS